MAYLKKWSLASAKAPYEVALVVVLRGSYDNSVGDDGRF
jgi:hypothetical protein